MWTENRFPDGYRYSFPPTPNEYAQALKEMVHNPWIPGFDLTPSGAGVAPLPVGQRTRIGVFEAGG